MSQIRRKKNPLIRATWEVKQDPPLTAVTQWHWPVLARVSDALPPGLASPDAPCAPFGCRATAASETRNQAAARPRRAPATAGVTAVH